MYRQAFLVCPSLLSMTKPSSLHGFLSASTKNNARFSVSRDWLGENRVPSLKEINWSGNVRQKMETQFNELTVLSDVRHPVSLGRDRWNPSHVVLAVPNIEMHASTKEALKPSRKNQKQKKMFWMPLSVATDMKLYFKIFIKG